MLLLVLGAQEPVAALPWLLPALRLVLLLARRCSKPAGCCRRGGWRCCRPVLQALHLALLLLLPALLLSLPVLLQALWALELVLLQVLPVLLQAQRALEAVVCRGACYMATGKLLLLLVLRAPEPAAPLPALLLALWQALLHGRRAPELPALRLVLLLAWRAQQTMFLAVLQGVDPAVPLPGLVLQPGWGGAQPVVPLPALLLALWAPELVLLLVLRAP